MNEMFPGNHADDGLSAAARLLTSSANPAKRAVLYLRMSTPKQPHSIEEQRADLLKYAVEHGMEIIDEYVDGARSGLSTKWRGDYQQLMQDAAASDRSWNNVLVWDVARYSRGDSDDTTYDLVSLRRAGVHVVFVSQNIPDGSIGVLIRQIYQWIASEQIKHLSRSVIRGQLSLAAEGYWVCGPSPAGYDRQYLNARLEPYMIVRYVPNGKKQILRPDGTLDRELEHGEHIPAGDHDRIKLVLGDPAVISIIQYIYQMYLQGLGYRAIAQRLNAEGVPALRNGEWSSHYAGEWTDGTVRGILSNPTVTGVLYWNRLSQGKVHRIQEKKAVPLAADEIGHRKRNREDDWIIVPNAHPAIIDLATFLKVQQLRKDKDWHGLGNEIYRGRAKDSDYVLVGLMKCSCGRNFVGRASHDH